MASSPVIPPAPARPFDAIASEYDAAFTDRLLGRWLRSMVWQRFAQTFDPGQRVLELGCGTGEDAIWLARQGVIVTATDASTAMLEITRRKAEAAGVSDRVSVSRLDLESLQRSGPYDGLDEPYDGVVSNFGPMNCVEDRRALADGLGGLVRSGGRVVLVAMGPVCPWEIVWHLGHGQVRTAFRRFRRGAVAHVGAGETVRVWYPSHRRLGSEFGAHFKVLETVGIGLLLPPSAMAHLVDRAPRAFARLAVLDRRLAGAPPWRWLNDHYLMVLERR